MLKDAVAVWDNCLDLIKRNVSQQSYKTWFEPIKPIKVNHNALTIQVPNKFFYEWLEENYVVLLRKSIRRELGDKGQLEYQILVENHRKTGVTNKKNGNSQVPGEFSANDIKNPFVIPGIKKLKVDPQLKKDYRFENFIEGDCNKLARSAGIAIARNPGGTAFNPLVIYGDVGLGKTHLAHAIGNEIIEHFDSKTVLCVTTERFTNQLVQAIKNQSINDFVNFYQMIDVLIVDDIQFLAGRTKTQEIFFNIFNQLHQNHKQIIVTSDRPPKDLEGMEDRLISRFKWGLSADLQAPDFETRLAILESKTEKEGVNLSHEVTEFICFNIKNNIRELEGVLISLIAQSTLNQRHIDIDLTKEVIQKFVHQINKEVTVENIKNLVANHFELPVEKLQSKTRKRSIVIARQLSMYLAKNLTNKSLKFIGDNFGGRDHSTVIYSCRAVQDLMDTDLIFKDTVADLEKKIQMSLTSG
jgi:chromosomal replication initiator protein